MGIDLVPYIPGEIMKTREPINHYFDHTTTQTKHMSNLYVSNLLVHESHGQQGLLIIGHGALLSTWLMFVG